MQAIYCSRRLGTVKAYCKGITKPHEIIVKGKIAFLQRNCALIRFFPTKIKLMAIINSSLMQKIVEFFYHSNQKSSKNHKRKSSRMLKIFTFSFNSILKWAKKVTVFIGRQTYFLGETGQNDKIKQPFKILSSHLSKSKK